MGPRQIWDGKSKNQWTQIEIISINLLNKWKNLKAVRKHTEEEYDWQLTSNRKNWRATSMDDIFNVLKENHQQIIIYAVKL